MAYAISYISPAGVVWPIAIPGAKKQGVWMAAEGIEGLMAQGEDATVQSVGRAGVIYGGTAIEALEGTLTVHVRKDAERGADEVYRAWRAAWSRRESGTLVVSGGSYGDVSCRVRLAEWIGPPTVDPAKAGDLEMQITLRSDDGVWWTRDTEHTGNVTVTNSGVGYMCPRIRWSGAGGAVTLPSGATFTLPAVAEQRTLHLDADESCVVLRQDGTVDDALWASLASMPPEGVAEGATATYSLPDGAALVTATGLDSPWQ